MGKHTDLLKTAKALDLANPEQVGEFYQSLSELSFQDVLKIVYSGDPAELPPVLRDLRQLSRSKLAARLHSGGAGLDPRLVNYLHFPSREKSDFVRALERTLRSKYRWLNTKVLHAWAFRQGFFDKPKNARLRRLYWGRQIPKSGGRSRRLWIPIRPLADVQKLILRRALDPLLDKLLPNIHGFRPGGRYTIFENAVKHVRIRDRFAPVPMRPHDPS